MTFASLSLAARLLFRWQNLLAGVGGVLIGGVVGFSLLLWSSRTAPLIIRSVYELDGVVAQGGHLDIVFDIDRLRDCPSETSRWLWTWVDQDGRRMRQFFPLVSTPTAITDAGLDQHFILSVPLPAGIWPGEWFYISRTIEHCPLLPSLFRPYIHESPDIPIHIEGGKYGQSVLPPDTPADSGSSSSHE